MLKAKLYLKNFHWDCMAKTPEEISVPKMEDTEVWLDHLYDYIFADKSEKYRESRTLNFYPWQRVVTNTNWKIELAFEDGVYMSDLLGQYLEEYVYTARSVAEACQKFSDNKEEVAKVITRNRLRA